MNQPFIDLPEDLTEEELNESIDAIIEKVELYNYPTCNEIPTWCLKSYRDMFNLSEYNTIGVSHYITDHEERKQYRIGMLELFRAYHLDRMEGK